MRRSIVIGMASSIIIMSGCATPPPPTTQTETVGAVTRSPPKEPSEAEKQAAFERLKREQEQKRAELAEAKRKYDAMREEKKKAETEVKAQREAEFNAWKQTNRGYLLKLCDTAPGDDHVDAWDNFHIAVSSDTQRAAAAKDAGKLVVECDKLRNNAEQSPDAANNKQTSKAPTAERVYRWSGYTWSNARRARADREPSEVRT